MGAGSGEAAGSGGLEQKTFPLEKILTISAGDFAQTQGLGLHAYRPIGVHHDKIYDLGSVRPEDVITIRQDFAAKVPEGATLVVDYKIFMVPVDEGYVYVSQSGTALILLH